MPRRDARRVVIGVQSAGSRNGQSRSAEVAGTRRNRIRKSGLLAAAVEADRGLLRRTQRERISEFSDRPRHLSAVIPPRERHPGPVIRTLVAKIRGLLERLVVIDPE